MFKKDFYQCPVCSADIRQKIEDDCEVECLVCKRRFQVMFDKISGKVGFIDLNKKKIPEPLYLPKGSIRSLITIAMAVSCWALIFQEKDVPAYLFSLILTIIGYYFGFRTKMKAATSRIHDVSSESVEPLFLPHGFIRFFLISGFVISTYFLYIHGAFKNAKNLEFFVILYGLIFGYVFARFFSSIIKFFNLPIIYPPF